MEEFLSALTEAVETGRLQVDTDRGFRIIATSEEEGFVVEIDGILPRLSVNDVREFHLSPRDLCLLFAFRYRTKRRYRQANTIALATVAHDLRTPADDGP